MRTHEILIRKRSTTSEAEQSSSRRLLMVSKNTDVQMMENKRGETEVHVEPLSTTSNEGFKRGERRRQTHWLSRGVAPGFPRPKSRHRGKRSRTQIERISSRSITRNSHSRAGRLSRRQPSSLARSSCRPGKGHPRRRRRI